MTDGTHLIRPEVQNLPTYNAGLSLERFACLYGTPCRAKLDSNENPYGPSERVIAAIRSSAAGVAFYPDAGNFILRKSIGKKVNLAEDRIVIGNGSEDLIGTIYRAILQPGDKVITICPSFGLHEIGALAFGAQVQKLTLEDDWRFPVERLCNSLKDAPKILIFSSPSNPAGSAITQSEFEYLTSSIGPEMLFVFDEAYFEFLTGDVRFDAYKWLEGCDFPWVSLRTLSKAYGLAGARIGYALCSDARLADALMKTRNPFGVNALAVAAAIEALGDDDHMTNSVERITRERERIRDHMVTREFEVAPSHANFLFFNTGRKATDFAEELRHQGVLIKAWLEEPYLDWARVTVGLPEQNDAFLTGLDHVSDQL